VNELLSTLIAFIKSETAANLLRALVIAAVGLAVARAVSSAFHRASARYLDPRQQFLIRRLIYYLLVILFLVSALRELGFSLAALLGAAGVISVALGFAAQTSASNLISGLFLITERSFQMGDLIKVGDVTGEVLSVDLLSIKIRTLDNLLVRIPNETLIKANVTNLTKFPIRRVDLKIGVAYKEDLKRVRGILMEVADNNPLCLEEPAPRLYVLGLGDSSVDLQFSVWVKTDRFLDLRSSMLEEIKAAFDRESVEIPFPHVSLYAGSETEPIPIRIEGKFEGAERENRGKQQEKTE
jgi:small-conductance mechanosensitive channel